MTAADILSLRDTENKKKIIVIYRSLAHITKLLCILLQYPIFQTKIVQICPLFFSQALFLKMLLYFCFSLLYSHLPCSVLEFSNPGSLLPGRAESSLPPVITLSVLLKISSVQRHNNGWAICSHAE